MTQAAESQQHTVNLGEYIRERSGISVEDLARLRQTETYVDFRGSTWQINKGAPTPSFAGHTVLYIALESEDVRIYGAPVPRENMSATEKKAMEAKRGVFVVWTLRQNAGTLGIDTLLDPEAFASYVAKEIRDAFDAYSEDVLGGNEADDMLEFLKSLPPNTTLLEAIAKIEAGDHEEEEEDEKVSKDGKAPNGAASPGATA